MRYIIVGRGVSHVNLVYGLALDSWLAHGFALTSVQVIILCLSSTFATTEYFIHIFRDIHVYDTTLFFIDNAIKYNELIK